MAHARGTLPQAKRPGWWHQHMTLSAERGAPPDGAETVAVVELAEPTRAYHQPSRGLPTWVVDYALLRLLQGWDHQTIAQHVSAWLPQVFHPWLSTRTVRRWLQDTKKEGRLPRDALRRAHFPFCEISATALARQASHLQRV